MVWFSSYFCPQEAEAFALYHKALDLQKHDKFEESAKAYHELLKTPLLKEVKYHTAYSPVKAVKKTFVYMVAQNTYYTVYWGCKWDQRNALT